MKLHIFANRLQELNIHFDKFPPDSKEKHNHITVSFPNHDINDIIYNSMSMEGYNKITDKVSTMPSLQSEKIFICLGVEKSLIGTNWNDYTTPSRNKSPKKKIISRAKFKYIAPHAEIGARFQQQTIRFIVVEVIVLNS